MGIRCVAPPIFNCGTGWMWVVRYMSKPLYSWWRVQMATKWLVGLQCLFGILETENCFVLAINWNTVPWLSSPQPRYYNDHEGNMLVCIIYLISGFYKKGAPFAWYCATDCAWQPLFTDGICCDKGYLWNMFAIPNKFLVFPRIFAPWLNNTAHITFF